MAAVLPDGGARPGGILGQFAQRRPRIAAFIQDRPAALTQFGLGLLSGRSRSDAWANAAQGLAYGQQADQARRERTQQEEEQARQEEAVNALLMSPEFASLPAEYRNMLTADPELARSFVASQLEQRTSPGAPPELEDFWNPETGQIERRAWVNGQWTTQGLGAPDAPLVTVDNRGSNGIDYGDPETGFAWARNPDGTVQTGANGAPIQVPIIGGSVEAERAAAEQAAAAGDANATRQQSVLLTNIDGALALAEQPLTTGFTGNLAAALPGTPAYDLRAKVDTIKAIIGFQTLQEMRNASTTGAALGQITERELAFLQSTWGNLDPNQSYGAFVEQLNAARQITLDIVEGRRTVDDAGNVTERAVTAAPSAGTPPPPPTVGQVMDGYRFNGGDPADPNNWTRVQ